MYFWNIFEFFILFDKKFELFLFQIQYKLLTIINRPIGDLFFVFTH